MLNGVKKIISRWSLVQSFILAGLVITILGTLVIGNWVGEQIKSSIINESASTTALYLDSFIVANLQDFSNSKTLTPEHIEILNKQLTETNLGKHIVTVKVWDKNGTILYSNRPSLIGLSFPVADDLSAAWDGKVTSLISSLKEDENFEERRFYTSLLEIYVPVRQTETKDIIAVAEFYQEVDGLEMKIAAAQRQSWLAVIAGMTIMYLLLVGFVRGAGGQIKRQEIALTNQVEQLKEVLAENDELDQRVRRAAANATALNETLLRRISADLHAGPVQEMGVALLRLDQALSENKVCRVIKLKSACNDNLPIVQNAVQNAMQEVRVIATGLGLPQLDRLALTEIIAKVVRAHEQLTGTKVKLSIGDLPEQVDLPIKITVYRVIQEALHNAHHHAAGAGQEALVTFAVNLLQVEVSDQGPGFDVTRPIDGTEHLGLAGMRERVESIGGIFKVESRINEGTKVTAQFFLENSRGMVYV